MTDAISKSQIDKLGERLRTGRDSYADLVMLDDYRRSFAEAYDATTGVIHKVLGLATTGRPSKSTQSIRDKLVRESFRLSQIQDIAGCRIVVLNTEHQEIVLEKLQEAIRLNGISTKVLDRRYSPSHGYRAVHIVCTTGERLVEVQLRTELQHVWAQVSEKLADMFDPSIKYGGGEVRLKAQLDRLSHHIAEVESDEKEIWLLRRTVHENNIKETPEQIEIAKEVQQRWLSTRSALNQMLYDILLQTGEIIEYRPEKS